MKSNQTSQIQKAVYFIMVNGLRDLRTKSLNATFHRQANNSEDKNYIPYLTIMIMGALISLVSVVVLL
jgi:uncharacterized membrane protein